MHKFYAEILLCDLGNGSNRGECFKMDSNCDAIFCEWLRKGVNGRKLSKMIENGKKR